MSKLKGELVRIQTKDNLELQGLLFEPEQKCDKAVIHIHGWTGNFYENFFLECIAEGLIDNNFAFLTFNNRGAGFIQEFMKKSGSKVEYVKIGGGLEHFEDCLIDIEAAVLFLQKRGFNKIYLQGHSTGAQKSAYFALKVKVGIQGLILLEPADDPEIAKSLLGNRYEEACKIARNYIKSGTPNKAMPSWVSFGFQTSAQRFLSIANPQSPEGRLFHFSGDLNKLKSINLPIIIIFGSKSQYQENPEQTIKILRQQLPNITTKLIEDGDHWFNNYEDNLQQTITNWLKQQNVSIDCHVLRRMSESSQ